MTPRGVVLFPGAGTSAEHPSLAAIAEAIAPVPTARLDFPYRLAGRRAPDRAPVLVAAVKEGVRAFAADIGAPTSSLVIGGRSMGGRMCSMASRPTRQGANRTSAAHWCTHVGDPGNT